MPNRLLKEGICTSDAINMLSSDSEVLFYRLLVVADDYGRMDGRVQIIKSQCFPLKDSFTSSKIEKLIIELQQATLITLYQVNNKPFFVINKWEQRVRSKEKYPSPESSDKTITNENDSNTLTDDSNNVTDDGLGLGLGLGLGKGSGKGASVEAVRINLPEQDLVSQEIWNEFLKLRTKLKAVNSPLAIKSLITELKKLKDQGNDPDDVVSQSIRSSWKDVYPVKSRDSPKLNQSNKIDFNRQQTELAKKRLFGQSNPVEKDITHEATAL